MSEDNASDTEVPCKICKQVIFMEDDPVHLRCITAREKSLVDMIFTLHCEINSIKNSFKSVESALQTLEAAFNVQSECECDVEDHEPEFPKQTLKKPSIEKTQAVKTSNAKKSHAHGRARPVTRSQASIPLSPLVIPNRTSSQPNITVTRGKRSRTSTTFSSAPSPPAVDVVRPPVVVPVLNDTSSQPYENNREVVGADISQKQTSSKNVTQNQKATTALTQMADSNAAIKPNESILIALPPSRNVFLSGLSPIMTEKNVNDYINKMCDYDIPVTVRKMRLREDADHSSFILFTGRNSDLFEMLIAPSFWPPNTIVDKFVENANFRNAKRNYKRLKPELPTSRLHVKLD